MMARYFFRGYMSIYDSLNKEQKDAVMHTEGPVLILAGAGSGKTRVLVHRIAYLIENKGVAPYNILAITFTNKAAGEMRERVDKLIGFGADQVWVATFHATCVRILRRHIDLLGYDNNFTIYDEDDSKSVMKQVFKTLDIDNKQLKEKTVLNAISRAKDELIGCDSFEKDARGFEEKKIADCYKEYTNVLRSNNALDFDDIIMLTVELFRRNPEVLDNYRERYKYIMVDEYQDTNTAQFEFVRLLADKYKNLCVVGDDDQSIYKFRGANITNILHFEENYENAYVVKLEQNYRSTQTILDAANAVIGNNYSRKQKALWSDRGKGDLIHFRQFDTAYEEAEYIADAVAKAARKNKSYSECAVLYRTNAQSRLIEEAFVRESIPYNLVGGVNFYDRKEIKDMLAYLRVVDNARDDLQVKRIINVPRRGIGQTSIDKVSEYAYHNGLTFFEACCQADRVTALGTASKKILTFANMIRVMKASVDSYGLKGLVNDIIEQTGYVSVLEESDEEDAKDRIENVYELVNKISYYEETEPEATLSGFLEEVALVSATDDIEEEVDKALLMTMHAAKGLEFSNVFLAGCEDGVFPSHMSIATGSDEEIEEERRLAYVGITRAKDDLTVTYARCRMNRGEFQYNPVSRFIREIPENLMDNRLPKQKKYDDYEDGFGSSFGSSFGRGSSEAVGIANKPATVKTISKPLASFSKGMGMKKADKLDFGVGDRVSHVKYGTGTVTNIDDDVKDYKVTVEFDSAGKKVMYAMFAKLKKQ